MTPRTELSVTEFLADAELSGLITDLEERTHQAGADLAHIDDTLRLFDQSRPGVDQAEGARAAARSGFFATGRYPPLPRGSQTSRG
jgi:hypothetical protein